MQLYLQNLQQLKLTISIILVLDSHLVKVINNLAHFTLA